MISRGTVIPEYIFQILTMKRYYYVLKIIINIIGVYFNKYFVSFQAKMTESINSQKAFYDRRYRENDYSC